MQLTSGMEEEDGEEEEEEEEKTVSLVAGRPLLTAPQFLGALP